MSQAKARPLSAEALRAIERRGLARYGLRDLYHLLMRIPLSGLLAGLAGSFLVVNFVFAVIFWLIGGLAGVRADSFLGAFFFSLQTLSTTGYGAVYPVSIAANAVAGAEMLTGLLGTALATGILFARLSRPQARVLFSNVVVVRPYQGVPTLMFRLANQRRNLVVEARISVIATEDVIEEDGSLLRRMISLRLERDISPVFSLSWVVMHKITPDSPLYGKDIDAMRDSGNVIICSFTGLDDTLNATIYARHVYGAEDLRFNHRFVDILERGPSGEISVDYHKFHQTVEAATAAFSGPDA